MVRCAHPRTRRNRLMTKVNKGRALLLVIAAGALLGLVAAVASWHDVAIASFGLTGVVAFAWIALWARSVTRSVARLQKKVNATASATKKLPAAGDVTELADAVAQVRAAVDRIERTQTHQLPATQRLLTEVREIVVSVQRIPSSTVELERLYDRIVDHDRLMPELGNWALSPRTVAWVAEHIATTPIDTIVECGSGSSTVWWATALERRGGPGQIVSLESSAEYAEITRGRIAALGLSHRAEVIHAPLVDLALPGRDPHPWYDLSVLPADLTRIDLLFVDGPVGAIAPQVRYPGFPMLADRLPAGALVILDDTPRPEETEIAERWMRERPAGRRLTIAEQLDRSIVFRVDVDAE
ncbi:hypothetical protein GEV26_05385 [Aeromicrobium yanjiei]|uniref:Uncharacterized protein n=2 Tax=Aeromicrobium yanjiei TaxID=2662028 RepID=A0A5Q2MIG1_9ACTN|nr:hypothetical protein GEV26_05385 [Aeromicrobium yanjiei]